MASLQFIKKVSHIRFRLAGKPYRHSLGITDEDEAEDRKKQVEITLHRIEVGLIPPPPPGADVPLYVLTGGKEGVKAVAAERPVMSLKELWDGYLASLSNNYALSRRVVDKNFLGTVGKLPYPKEQERPDFQTWEQIERQVERGGLSEIEIADLWDCLFLDIGTSAPTRKPRWSSGGKRRSRRTSHSSSVKFQSYRI